MDADREAMKKQVNDTYSRSQVRMLEEDIIFRQELNPGMVFATTTMPVVTLTGLEFLSQELQAQVNILARNDTRPSTSSTPFMDEVITITNPANITWDRTHRFSHDEMFMR